MAGAHRKIYILIKYGEWHLINLHNAVVPAAASFNCVYQPSTGNGHRYLLFDFEHSTQMEMLSVTRTYTHEIVVVVRSIIECNELKDEDGRWYIRAYINYHGIIIIWIELYLLSAKFEIKICQQICMSPASVNVWHRISPPFSMLHSPGPLSWTPAT